MLSVETLPEATAIPTQTTTTITMIEAMRETLVVATSESEATTITSIFSLLVVQARVHVREIKILLGSTITTSIAILVSPDRINVLARSCSVPYGCENKTRQPPMAMRNSCIYV